MFFLPYNVYINLISYICINIAYSWYLVMGNILHNIKASLMLCLVAF